MTTTRRSGENHVTAFMHSDRPMAGNIIHTEEGARDFGFQSAIVVGGCVYGWTVPAILDVLGEEWLSNGWSSLRFRRPTYVGDEMTAKVTQRDDGVCELTMQKQGGETVIFGEVGLGLAPWLDELAMPTRLEPAPRPEERIPLTMANAPLGQDLPPMTQTISKESAIAWARDRQRDANPLWHGDSPLVHPGWLNGRMTPVMQYTYTYNPSLVSICQMQHLAPIQAGQTLTAAGTFREAFERKGSEYWVVDGVLFGEDGRQLMRIRQSNLFKIAKRQDVS